MRTLKVTSGPAEGQSLEVESESIVGRSAVDLEIADPEISGRHAAVRPIEDGIEVEDLGSTNGTFVDGKRIDAPVSLTADATIRVGLTTIAVELEFPKPLAQPDVTAPRRVVPAPDVTAPRAIPDQPDVTAPRAIPDQPDVTAPRAIPDQPDVTAPRAIPDPDVTAPRSVPPPQVPRAEPEDADGDGGRRGLLIGAVLAVVALILIVLLVGGGGGTEEHDVDITLRLTPATQADQEKFSTTETKPGTPPVRLTVSGQASGEPFGPGNVTADVTRTPLKGQRGVQLSTSSSCASTAAPCRCGRCCTRSTRPPARCASRGTGEFTGGTGDYEGIEGSIQGDGQARGAPGHVRDRAPHRYSRVLSRLSARPPGEPRARHDRRRGRPSGARGRRSSGPSLRAGRPVLGLRSKRGNVLLVTATRMRWPAGRRCSSPTRSIVYALDRARLERASARSKPSR